MSYALCFKFGTGNEQLLSRTVLNMQKDMLGSLGSFSVSFISGKTASDVKSTGEAHLCLLLARQTLLCLQQQQKGQKPALRSLAEQQQLLYLQYHSVNGNTALYW